jgi:NADP-dependent 3-hydroxy acid dehydrogenase YdfG
VDVPRTVVVTGASAGVGRATAHAFAKEGAQIALIARGAEGLQAAAAEVERHGAKALALSLDVADADAVEAAADRIENEFGPIDVWVNCAMATIFAPFHCISPPEYRRATEVTYLGFVYGTMAALKRMRVRNRGTIVQVGSALAYWAIPLQSAYCGAKFRHPRLYRQCADRVAARRRRRADRQGPNAGAEHAAIRLGTQQDEPSAATGAADLSA